MITTKFCKTCGKIMWDVQPTKRYCDACIRKRNIKSAQAKEMVLAYEAAFDSMSMAFRLPNTEEFINAGDYYALDAVTHWMPLPTPPEVTL